MLICIDHDVTIAEQCILNAKVLLLNLSTIYQSLNAESILDELVDKRLIQPVIRDDVRAYGSTYIRNLSTGLALVKRDSPPNALLDLCSMLEAGNDAKQRKLAMTLKAGLY